MMFPNAKFLVSLHVIFLLAGVSASPVDIATGIEGMKHDFFLATSDSLKFYLVRADPDKENTPVAVGGPATPAVRTTCREIPGPNVPKWEIVTLITGGLGTYTAPQTVICHRGHVCRIVNGEAVCVKE
jgi:hypothetical protein